MKQVKEGHTSREPVPQLALVVVGKQRLGCHDEPHEPHLAREGMSLVGLFEQVSGDHQPGDSL